MPNLERHTLVSPYHYCQKCWWRYALKDLRWQLGFLVCPKDYDTLLIGQREANIQRVLTSGNPQSELAPDEKLTQPFANGIIEDILL